jgi:cellulose synthase/poly-beta-1,6-N-acetylglucosamine synthase-like glycosyltransferase
MLLDAFLGAYLLCSLALLVVALSTLTWMVDSWRTPESVAETRFPPPDEPCLSFSLLVPARDEETVLRTTVTRILEQDHPDFDVVVVVGDDDPGTATVAHSLADEFPNVRVAVDESPVKNKPKALNTGLQMCTGQVIGVFDAEDEVAPALLRHVDACFRATDSHVVQGGVQLMNFQTSWWSLRNVLEYYFWFSSRLHLHARKRFIPLGGNTVFVRSDLIREVGGWDPECLAEDCELGVRLSSRGARVSVAYDADLATREETPPSLGGLLKQRTRWSQGFMQVLHRGEWHRLPTRRQRFMAAYLLTMPFMQAFAGVLIPVALLCMFVLKAPDVIVLATFVPLLPTLVTIGIEAVGLQQFGRDFRVHVRLRDYVRLVVGTLPYQIVLAIAAVRAAVRELRGDGSWEKTSHVGAHRPLDPSGAQETVR